jgi:hypothetical protein
VTIPEEITASVQHLELLAASIKTVEARLEKLREARRQTVDRLLKESCPPLNRKASR